MRLDRPAASLTYLLMVLIFFPFISILSLDCCMFIEIFYYHYHDMRPSKSNPFQFKSFICEAVLYLPCPSRCFLSDVSHPYNPCSYLKSSQLPSFIRWSFVFCDCFLRPEVVVFVYCGVVSFAPLEWWCSFFPICVL